jgi:FkbM family methyltransferase
VFADRLARLLYPRGASRRILRGPARGLHFIVAPGMGVSYALGTPDAAPRGFGRYVRPGMCVYDVGANKGQMTMIFASLVGAGGRVVTLEPVPEEFSALSRNVEINRLGHVAPIEAAAADADGTAAFSYSAARPTQGKLRDVERSYVVPGTGTTSVRTVRLDSIAATHPPPDVIKIDVEGAAASVLRGAAGLLASRGPLVYIELHGPEEQAGVRDELLSRGYVAEALNGETVADPTIGWHSPLWCRRTTAVGTRLT